jgi:hypothetical protein
MGRLIAAGQWTAGDREILIVADAGYDLTRLAFVLADLPVVLLGRLRSDRVLRLPAPPRRPGTSGRSPRHGGEFAPARPQTWPAPQRITGTSTARYGTARPSAGTGCISGSPTVAAGWITAVSCMTVPTPVARGSFLARRRRGAGPAATW